MAFERENAEGMSEMDTIGTKTSGEVELNKEYSRPSEKCRPMTSPTGIAKKQSGVKAGRQEIRKTDRPENP